MSKITQKYLTNLVTGAPAYVTVYANNVCQLRCDMCFYWDAMQQAPQEITLTQATQLALSLKGVLHISVSGGEPTLRKDLVEFVSLLCKHSNAPRCSVLTNGFQTKHVVSQVKEIVRRNPTTEVTIRVSIDGTEQVHDRIRGIRGSYRRAISTYRQLRRLSTCDAYANLNVDINTCISRWNYDNFDTFCEEVKLLNPCHHSVTITRGKTKEPDAADIPESAVTKVMKYVRGQRPKKWNEQMVGRVRDVMYDEIERIIKHNTHKYNCKAGKRFATVYQDGSVHSCEILNTIHPDQSSLLGNLNDVDWDIRRVLDSQTAHDVKKFICNKKCFCTFENAKFTDVVYTPSLLAKVITK